MEELVCFLIGFTFGLILYLVAKFFLIKIFLSFGKKESVRQTEEKCNHPTAIVNTSDILNNKTSILICEKCGEELGRF